MLTAALEGFGLAYLPRGFVEPHLADGRLAPVLEDWLPPFSGYHLYYASRRQATPAFAIVLEALRYRAPNGENGGATNSSGASVAAGAAPPGPD
jgi:DNA-binding transcriptional LysR family regulator